MKYLIIIAYRRILFNDFTGAETMKQLLVVLILCTLILMPTSQTAPLIDYYNNSDTTAEAPTQTVLRRVYGVNLAQEIYLDIDFYFYRNLVHEFTDNGSRWIMDYTMVNSSSNYYARRYIMQQMEELSNRRIEIELIGKHLNIVGKLKGYLPGNHSAIVISAHYDSPQNSAGANCDGSGIAAVLSLVEALSKYEWPLDIYFIAFNGLFTFDFMTGSPEVALFFKQRGIEILTLYNIDTILVPGVSVMPDERVQMGYLEGGIENYHKSQYWAELTRMMSNNYGVDVIVPISSNSFYLWERSDHFAFFERTYTNLVCAFESGRANDDAYQNSDDLWSNPYYRYDLGKEVAGVIGASVAFTMSRAYGESTTIDEAFSVGAGSTQRYYFAVTTPTIVNVSARWFGGPSTFLILNPEGNPIVTKAYSKASAWEATDIFSQMLTEKGLYSIFVYNPSIQSVGYELEFTYDTDIDGNGILDKDEYWLDQSYFVSDKDSDGISDAYEIFWGLNPNSPDSDNDNMPDKYEVDMGFDPLDASDANLDADGDGLTNAQEYLGGLNPFSKDTDNDGMDDLWELENGLDPLVNDADLDPDGDNLTNLEEYLQGSNPQEKAIQQNPMVWMILPVAAIASIVIVLYVRRDEIF